MLLGSSSAPTKYLDMQNESMLRTEPSFCIYSLGDGCEDEHTEALERTVTIGESIEAAEFSFGKTDMGLIQEEGEEEEEGLKGLNGIQTLSLEAEAELVGPPIHLGHEGFGGGVDLTLRKFDGSGDVEEYYKRMVDEFPSHPLILRNYAQLLESKGDLHGAEDYYFRATQADPEDGEILLQYAKLIWELHHDQSRASSYFERAAQAAPTDSHILAAYARFLWETDGDEEDKSQKDFIQIDEACRTNELENLTSKEESEWANSSLHLAARLDVAGVTANDSSKGRNGGVDLSLPDLDGSAGVEEYYKRMVDEFPSHPLFLRNYAQILQSRGDLHGAEDYYFRATLADPEDGEILSQYAKLTWELHHDRCRASSYFERAAQAASEDSHILAAYARFLWEVDDDEEDGPEQDYIQTKEVHCMSELENLTSKEEHERVNPSLHQAARLGHDADGVTATDSGKGENDEEYYRKKVEENPCHPLFLRNYAQFLQFEGNLEGAEEYYSRAILADPGDGEIISQYAKLVWEVHHDRQKALCYFEQAVQATPGDSNVLAAYASFLWEAGEDEEEDSVKQDHIQAPPLHQDIV